MVLYRLKTGFALARKSIGVLTDYPKLMIFPLVATIASLGYLGALFGVLFSAAEMSGTTLAVMFLYYLGTTFIASFCTSGLMFCSKQAFEGKTPSISAGFAAASKRIGPLFIWSIIAAIVGVLVRAIEEQDSVVADIVAAVVGVAWTIMTFFVIPVIVFEGSSFFNSFGRSKEMVKSTWGESIGTISSISLITFFLGLIGAVIGFALLLVLPFSIYSLIGLFVMVLMFVLVGQTLGGIAKTALYLYAAEGRAPARFADVESRM